MRMPTLQPYDHSRLRLTCHDGTYYYGCDQRDVAGFGDAKIVRYDPATGTESIVYDFGLTDFGEIQIVWYVPEDDLMFCVILGAGATASHVFVMRSGDKGASWTQVYDNTAGTRTMLNPESFARCDMADGSIVYYILEYTTAGGDTRLFKSTDKGASWSVLVTWNNAQVRHGHCLKWHPELRRLFMGFGDSSVESCVVDWDPALGTLSGATAPSAYNTAYAKSYQGYAYKVCTLALGRHRSGALNGWLYWALDVASSPDHRGIYRAKISTTGPGLTDLTRMAKFRSGSLAVHGFCTEDGRYVFFEGADKDCIPAPTANWRTWVWTSDNGIDFEPTSCMNNGYNSGAGSSPFQYAAGPGVDGKLFIMHAGGSAKQDGQQDSLIVEWGEPDIDDRLSIIHPVFWVAPGGVNGNMTENGCAGWNRHHPMADPAYPVANFTSGYGGVPGGGRLTYGARVQVAAGHYRVPYCLGSYHYGTPDGEPGVAVEIVGEGKDTTIWEHDSVATSDSFSIQSSVTPKTIFKGITIKSSVARRLLLPAAAGSEFHAYDSQIGPTGHASYSVGMFNTTHSGVVCNLVRSVLAIITSGDGIYAAPGSGGTVSLVMRQSVAIGGARAVRRVNTAGAFSLDLESCGLVGQSGHGINFESSATVASKRIRGCNFHGQGTAPVGNSAALTFTLPECDYNYVGANVSGVFDVAGHHNTVTTSQGLTYSDTAYTYSVASDSVLRGKYAALRGDVYDLERKRLKFPLPVGCVGDEAADRVRGFSPVTRAMAPVVRAA